jgi:hypothetical protein
MRTLVFGGLDIRFGRKYEAGSIRTVNNTMRKLLAAIYTTQSP